MNGAPTDLQLKPQFLAPKLANFPAFLIAIARWVLWRAELRRQKDGSVTWAKVPYNTRGYRASVTNPDDWDTFENVETAYLLGDYTGVGIVINGEDFHGIDLDDCRNPQTGEIAPWAQEILDQVSGYAEISPSGTGIKILANTNLDRSRANSRVELYTNRRFFALTGLGLETHQYVNGKISDLDWLVDQEFGDKISTLAAAGSVDELMLVNMKFPLDGWDLERVKSELLAHLSCDVAYQDWLSVGMALHHQGRGDPAWLDLWDDWSSTGATYTEGLCAQKWNSFHKTRLEGTATLRQLLHKTKEQRGTVAAETADSLLAEITAATDVRLLETQIAKKAAANSDISGTDRERLAQELRKRANELGLSLPIGTIRNWLKPKRSQNFPHLSPDGVPLGTIENTRVLLANMQATVRYNVISKQLEILIPGQAYTADNEANSTLARVLSEASRVGIPTKHLLQYVWEIADTNPFNPVATWIESKPWDGISRIDKFFASIHASCAEKYKHLVLKKWMLQSIAAAFAPEGIAAQVVLVFQGRQGIGKTRWILSLVPPELRNVVVTGYVLDTKNKDSLLLGSRHWLLEMGELNSSFARSDQASTKAWLTQPYDKIRRPYALTESTYPRRMSPFASVNDPEFLIDTTGNRRYMPLAVDKIDFDHGIDMQQLWAEFLVLYKAGETYYLSQEQMALVEANNEKFMVADPIYERIANAYDWEAPDVQWEEATATDVLIRLGISSPTKSQTMAASAAIRKLNGGRFRKSGSRRLLAIPKQNADFSAEKTQEARCPTGVPGVSNFSVGEEN